MGPSNSPSAANHNENGEQYHNGVSTTDNNGLSIQNEHLPSIYVQPTPDTSSQPIPDTQHEGNTLESSGGQRAPRKPTNHHHRVAPYVIGRPSHRNEETSEETTLTPNYPRSRFLLDHPTFEYILPKGGPLNFTIVEIISILPNWFRSRDMATRFLSNGISSRVHFLILDEHRQLDLTTEIQFERARDSISDAYRKVMRKLDPLWTKARHLIPQGWDSSSITVNDVRPEAAREFGWRQPLSVAYKSLAIGLKKLPEGNDAGDLTRALDFAMNHQKDSGFGNPVDFLFPDDLHVILNRIGRTHINVEQTDLHIIARYGAKLRDAQLMHYKEIADVRRQQQGSDFRNMQIPAQINGYPMIQPGPQSALQMHVVPHQAQNPFGQQHAAVLPLGMGVLVPQPSESREKASHHLPNFQPDPSIVYQSPYGKPTSLTMEHEAQIVPAITAWMKEHGQIAAEADRPEHNAMTEPVAPPNNTTGTWPAGMFEEPIGQESEEQWDIFPGPAPGAEPTQAAQDEFFPSISGINRIPELDPDAADQAPPDSADPGYSIFNFDELDAIWNPKESSSWMELPVRPKDQSPGEETNVSLAIDQNGPQDRPFEGYISAADYVSTDPVVERLVDRVEGDDLSDTSDLARAVRWARGLGDMGNAFDVRDVANIIYAIIQDSEQ
ncbi:hypothetical protein J1614_006736 [Plenodomus biglobosus]|nr:hypothetical protein J1614_006736 [Plenodomus biglobosus]